MSEETLATCRAVINDLMLVLEHRAWLLAERPNSSNLDRVAHTPLPMQSKVARGSPPVVVWLARTQPAKEGGGEGRVVRHYAGGRGSSGSGSG